MAQKVFNPIDLLNTLSLEEKVGQMLMFAFHGCEFNEQLKTQIDEFHLGGVIHFARNIINPEQVLKLNKDIQEYSKYPMFIGIDQEGGIVQRITKGTTPFPGAMALSATQQSIRKLHQYVGEDLKQMNYNMTVDKSIWRFLLEKGNDESIKKVIDIIN